MMLTPAQTRGRLEEFYIEQEWRRCAADPFYFITTHLWVESKRDLRGREPFKLLDYQIDDLNLFLSERYICVLKARQVGLSTLVMGYALWQLMFRPGGARVLVLSKSETDAQGNLAKMNVMYRHLEPWLRERGPRVKSQSQGSMQFELEDGSISSIQSFAATKTAGASNTADLVILDEFGLGEYQELTYKSVQPTTLAAASNPSTKGAVLIMLSTARGANNLFAKICRSSMRGENEYKFIFHPWHKSPFVDQKVYDDQKKFWTEQGQPWMIHSEYPSTAEEAFRESGGARFADLIPDADEYPYRCRLEPVLDAEGVPVPGQFVPVPDPRGRLWLRSLEPPDRRRFYAQSCDVAQGKGKDYTVSHVLSLDELGRVECHAVWFANDLEEFEATPEVEAIGWYFSGVKRAALLAPETQGGYGQLMVHQLQLKRYPNLYSWKPLNDKRAKSVNSYGFSMARGRKPAVINRLAEHLKDMLGLHPTTKSELETFVQRPNGTMEADDGCHDDHVMSLAVAVFILLEHGSSARAAIGEERTSDFVVGQASLNLDKMWRDIELATTKQKAADAKWQRQFARRANARRRSR